MKLREAQHALQSERKAYKILQLQYEGLLEGHRGQQQAEVAAATPETPAATEAESAAPIAGASVETEAVSTDTDVVGATADAAETPIEETKPEDSPVVDEAGSQDAEEASAEADSTDESEEKAAETSEV